MKQQLLLLFIIWLNAYVASAQVAQQWVKTYDATYHNDDIPAAITLDAAGNVIICGNLNNPAQSSSEMMIIKYDPSGNVLWNMPYANSTSVTPSDITTDADRNIYISCDVQNNVTNETHTHVIKYTCAGTLIWDAVYNTGTNFDDFSRRIALDNNGNIYVGLSSVCGLCYPNSNGNSESTIIKFDSLGIYITEMRTGLFWGNSGWNINSYYNALMDMEVLTAGNIYSIANLPQDSSIICCNNDLIDDFALSKHNTSGTREFLKRISRPLKQDFPFDMFVGNNEDVFITGSTKDTAANSKDSYLTAKLDSSGNVLYLVERGNAAWVSRGLAVAADGLGYAYVAGTTYQNGATSDIELIKYDPNGNEIWVRTYNSSFNSWDNAYSIIIDAQANLFIRGSSRNASNNDFLLLKYDSAGIFQWEQRYNGASNQEDVSIDFTVNSIGEVFVTGQSQGANGYDFVTIKHGFPTTATGDSLCSLVGINEIKVDGGFNISIYPNPVNSALTINCLEKMKEIKIVDVLGNVVYRDDRLHSVYELHIPTVAFSAGIYFIQLKTESRIINQKVIKN